MQERRTIWPAAHEGSGWAAPHSWTACMKGLFGHRADVFQDRAAVRPSLAWIWPCSMHPVHLLCKLQKHDKIAKVMQCDALLGFFVSVRSVTRTVFPVHQLLQFKSKWLLTACKDSMKAALTCLTLLLSDATTGTAGVEAWQWDELFQCDNA